MTYTARFAHLAEAPKLIPGNILKRGDIIGKMGSTGDSEADHVHFDLVRGAHTRLYTMAEIEAHLPEPAPLRQVLYFLDDELFAFPLVVTTPVAEQEYFVKRGKVHFHVDVVPKDRHETKEHYWLHWPRSMPGRVVAVHWDPKGYGHCIQIVFDA